MIVTPIVSFFLLASTGGEGAGAVNPLEWKSDLAIWTAVVFLFLLAILWKFAWKPITEGLNKREQNIADQIAQAEAANQKANDILADYESKLIAAREEVRGIVEQGRRNAEKQGQVLIDVAAIDAARRGCGRNRRRLQWRLERPTYLPQTESQWRRSPHLPRNSPARRGSSSFCCCPWPS